MLGVIRQNTYHANMHPLQSEFYDFREREDELAASLIAKNIRRLLRRAPSLIEKKQEAELSESPQSFSSVNENWPLQVTTPQGNESRLFHSDSSLSSNCSSMSSDSYASSSSLSPFSSRTSLSEANRQKRSNKDERNVEVVLPNDMMNRMTRDIVRMAEKEPNGIRGCQLQIELKDYDSDVVVSVGKINCDPKIPQNCVLRVHLVSIPPPPEAHGSQILLNRLLGSGSYNLYIKPGYTIEKRKLESKKTNFRL